MDLRESRLNKRFIIESLQEAISPLKVLENLYFSNALIYNLEVSYKSGVSEIDFVSDPSKHVSLKHRLPGKNKSFEHSDSFYSNIYRLLKKVSSNAGMIPHAGFFEQIRERKKSMWYYSTASVSHVNPSNFPDLLNVISLPIDQDSEFAKKAKRVFELDNFQYKNRAKYELLTKREVEVLRYIALGHKNPEIAEKLFISRRTVEQHRKNINRKLSPKSLGDLITYARAFDIL